MNQDFSTIAQRIESNPLGRLMYGHRELFHSNLLAWFFDTLPAIADEVFRPFSRPGHDSGRYVERERQHLDLVMHWPDRSPLIIENKVFSIPALDQLDEYEKVVSNWQAQPSLVLLSVSPPEFSTGIWTYLSYEELGQRIHEALPSSGSYEIETMQRYGALAQDLHTLVSAIDIQSDDERVWLPNSFLSVVSSSQMRAALHKARAKRVSSLLQKYLPGLEQPPGSGMTNATPYVEALEHVHAAGMHMHLGWQLQGNQFRRAVIYHDETIQGRDAASRIERETISREHPEFFSFPSVLPQRYAGRKEFNHYAPNFVYRYVKTPDLTIGELIEAAQTVRAELEELRTSGDVERPNYAVRKTT